MYDSIKVKLVFINGKHIKAKYLWQETTKKFHPSLEIDGIFSFVSRNGQKLLSHVHDYLKHVDIPESWLVSETGNLSQADQKMFLYFMRLFNAYHKAIVLTT